jgi:hypothetical protein
MDSGVRRHAIGKAYQHQIDSITILNMILDPVIKTGKSINLGLMKHSENPHVRVDML